MLEDFGPVMQQITIIIIIIILMNALSEFLSYDLSSYLLFLAPALIKYLF